MKHAIRYLGFLHGESPNLEPIPESYLTKDGSTGRVDSRPDDVDGILFGYMEKANKEFVAVAVEYLDSPVTVSHPIQLDPVKHTDGKGFGPQMSRFGDESAGRLLSDIIIANPDRSAELRKIATRTNLPFPEVSLDELRLKWTKSDASGAEEYVHPKPNEAVQKKLTPVTPRPGQATFRKRLLRTYGSCVLTGCAIGAAIEAAHIDEFVDAQSDNPRNGLMLRKDLHALFDAGLMAIHPESSTVYFAPDARMDRDYGSMHGTSTLHPPKAGFDTRAPSRAALDRRWRFFVERHGASLPEKT